MMKNIQYEPEELENELSLCGCFMKSSGDKMFQNVFAILWKSRSMLADFITIIGHA